MHASAVSTDTPRKPYCTFSDVHLLVETLERRKDLEARLRENGGEIHVGKRIYELNNGTDSLLGHLGRYLHHPGRGDILLLAPYITRPSHEYTMEKLPEGELYFAFALEQTPLSDHPSVQEIMRTFVPKQEIAHMIQRILSGHLERSVHYVAASHASPPDRYYTSQIPGWVEWGDNCTVDYYTRSANYHIDDTRTVLGGIVFRSTESFLVIAGGLYVRSPLRLNQSKTPGNQFHVSSLSAETGHEYAVEDIAVQLFTSLNQDVLPPLRARGIIR